MKTYRVRLEAPMSSSFFAVRAANSLDLDVAKKSVHELAVEADVETPFHVGLIVGASGSGKTTLAKSIYGEFKTYLDKSKAVIDQFPEAWSYDERAAALCGIGLSSVPCWLKPACCLSNGQQARAEAALAMAHGSGTIVLDEWTSVVDRTVAKVMSHCVQKYARKTGARIVLVSCHFDVVEWLQPDWIIDCNAQAYEDRRAVRPGRQERLCFEVREVSKSTWSRFSKYHYLSEKIPNGKGYYFGLFYGREQIGFCAFSNYVPWVDKSRPMDMHVHRVVIHPDFVGFGLGVKFMTLACQHIKDVYKYRVLAKLSNEALAKALFRSSLWRHKETRRQIGRMNHGDIGRGSGGFRENVKTYSFELI